MAQDIATGSSVAFNSSFFAQITNIDWGGLSRESVETTHMGTTTARTFKESDLYDAGELTVNGLFDPATRPPIDDASEELTLTWAASGNTWKAQGFMTGFSATGAMEEMMTFSGTVKLSGDITVT